MNLTRTRKPPRRNETRDLTHPIRVALNRLPGVKVDRNNVGSLEWAPGKMLRYGLGIGSADIVGACMCEVVTVPRHLELLARGQPAHPTRVFARYFALEVKWPGETPTEDQERWMRSKREIGAFACVVHSVDEALQAVERCRRGASQ